MCRTNTLGKSLGAGMALAILAAVLITCSPTQANNSSGYYTPSTPVGQAIGVAIDSSNNIDISGWTGATSGTTTYGAPGYWQNTTLYAMALGQGSYFSVNWGAVDSSKNFYVAGTVGSSSTTSVPVYWENGAMTSLNMGASYSYGVAYSVAVNGGNLYIVGAVGTSSNNLVPCYWVGGTQYLLAFNSQTYSSGWAASVAFDSNGYAYFAGAVASSTGSSTPVYWVVTSGTTNSAGQVGQLYLLTMNTVGGVINTYGSAGNVGVYGSTSPQTIYISGFEGTSSSTNVPCYWKGLTSGVTNAPTDLSLGGNASFDLNWAALDGSGDFYLVGGVGSSSSMNPCYWEILASGSSNLNPTILPAGTNSSGEAYGIAFDYSTPANVYIAGAVGQLLPCYWKNYVLNMLTTGNAQELQEAKRAGGKPNNPWWKHFGHP